VAAWLTVKVLEPGRGAWAEPAGSLPSLEVNWDSRETIRREPIPPWSLPWPLVAGEKEEKAGAFQLSQRGFSPLKKGTGWKTTAAGSRNSSCSSSRCVGYSQLAGILLPRTCPRNCLATARRKIWRNPVRRFNATSRSFTSLRLIHAEGF